MAGQEITWHELESFWREPAKLGLSYKIEEPPEKRRRFDAAAMRYLLHGEASLFDEHVVDIGESRKGDGSLRAETTALREGRIPCTAPEIKELRGYLHRFQDKVDVLPEAAQPKRLESAARQLSILDQTVTILAKPALSAQGCPVFVKLVDDVATFPMTVFQARYDRCAAFTLLCLNRPSDVYFIVRDKKTPARTALYRMAAGSTELGLASNEVHLMLNAYAKSMKDSCFPNIAAEPIDLKRPHWLPVVTSLSQNGYHLWPTTGTA